MYFVHKCYYFSDHDNTAHLHSHSQTNSGSFAVELQQLTAGFLYLD